MLIKTICEMLTLALFEWKMNNFFIHFSFSFFQVLDDWKYIAMVLDRLLLYIFLAVTFGGTVGILMNAPHIFEYVDQDAIIAAIMKDNKNNTG